MPKQEEIDYPRHRAAALDALHARLAAKAAVVDFLRSANVFRPSNLLDEVRDELEAAYDDVASAAAGAEGAAVKTPNRRALRAPPPAPRALPAAPARPASRKLAATTKRGALRPGSHGATTAIVLGALRDAGGAVTVKALARLPGISSGGAVRGCLSFHNRCGHVRKEARGLWVLTAKGEKYLAAQLDDNDGEGGAPAKKPRRARTSKAAASERREVDPDADDDEPEAEAPPIEEDFDDDSGGDDDDAPFSDLDRIEKPRPASVLGLANEPTDDFAIVDAKTGAEVARFADLGKATKSLRLGQRVRRVSTGSWMTQPLTGPNSIGNDRDMSFDPKMRSIAVGDEALDVEGLDEMGG